MQRIRTSNPLFSPDIGILCQNPKKKTQVRRPTVAASLGGCLPFKVYWQAFGPIPSPGIDLASAFGIYLEAEHESSESILIPILAIPGLGCVCQRKPCREVQHRTVPLDYAAGPAPELLQRRW